MDQIWTIDSEAEARYAPLGDNARAVIAPGVLRSIKVWSFLQSDRLIVMMSATKRVVVHVIASQGQRVP